MLLSKIKTLAQDGLDPFIKGKRNFDNQVDEIESLAKERAETCKGCRYFKDEPIQWLRVEDKSILELSGKSCGKCGCVLSYKTRQSIKTCSKWSKR